jgi:hypothetical protein
VVAVAGVVMEAVEEGAVAGSEEVEEEAEAG